MTQQSAQDAYWYQLVVTDEAGLSGYSVVQFVEPLIRRLGACSVGLSDLEGALAELKAYEGQVISANDFLRKAISATQFDWAFLYLYVKPPEFEPAALDDDKDAMQKADLTVRLADDAYFYVYGREYQLMDDVRKSYPGAELTSSKFSGLNIPY